jgi:hypothetical protein
MGDRRSGSGRSMTLAASVACRRRVSATGCAASSDAGPARCADRRPESFISGLNLSMQAWRQAGFAGSPCRFGQKQLVQPRVRIRLARLRVLDLELPRPRRLVGLHLNTPPARRRMSSRSRHCPACQPSSARRKRAPCFANSSCDGASGLQIDAALAISTAPGVKDSMTAAPSYSTSRSASRIPFQSW